MPGTLPLPLILLIGVFAAAIGAAVYVLVSQRQRRAVLRRVAGTADSSGSAILQRPGAAARPTRGVIDRLGDWAASRTTFTQGDSTRVASKLVHAGFDSPAAAPMFALLRLASMITIPILGVLLAPRDDPMYFYGSIALSIFIGMFGPQAVLDSLTSRRQDTIRKGVPDALDLLVVCVEAGVALDASIQRVAKEMLSVHPVLAEEFGSMSRRVAAGMQREEALQGLYQRTGLDELRGLASHMLQSEKWGTSIAGVLRVYAEQLRKKRKLRAEKRAATASTRMLLPLAVFIFPTIFIVLLGPAFIEISKMFDTMAK
jgi:tight adherence protein C